MIIGGHKNAHAGVSFLMLIVKMPNLVPRAHTSVTLALGTRLNDARNCDKNVNIWVF